MCSFCRFQWPSSFLDSDITQVFFVCQIIDSILGFSKGVFFFFREGTIMVFFKILFLYVMQIFMNLSEITPCYWILCLIRTKSTPCAALCSLSCTSKQSESLFSLLLFLSFQYFFLCQDVKFHIGSTDKNIFNSFSTTNV